ncbi:MAG: hypothetical protein PWP65_821 [Clostridia bacterium]|nr:hypothetical protein [Clostridia bacterium]
MRFKKLNLLLGAALGILLLAAGCTLARKPAPPAPPPSRTAPAPAPSPPAPAQKPLPTSPTEAHRLAAKLADEAQKTPGVKAATVVLSGNTAFVGLDLKSEVEASRTSAIKKEVVDRLKRAEPRLTTVSVTSDPDTVARIKKVAEGIRGGRPVTDFTRELAEIARRITPSTTR